MQPKNKSERTKAFLNFLLLFLISIAIIITTVFFSIEVPFKQNDDLRKQNFLVQRDRVFTSDFLTEMSGIAVMLDSINTSSKPDLLDGEISERIKKLNIKVNADSVYDKILYQNVVQNLDDLRQAKKQLRDITAKSDNINELQKQNDDLRQQLQITKTSYENLLIQLNQRK